MSIRLLLSFAIVILTQTILAQKNANNPLSSFGIGELSGNNNAIFNAIGNTSSSQIDSLYVNYNNPASYSYIAKGQPIFSIGINNTLHYSSQNGTKEFGSYQQIDHFVFGIAFAKILGFSFGLTPFTKSDYHFYQLESLGNDLTMRHNYDGTGNSNLFFGGLSVQALNLKKHKLSIGTNLGYLFGTTKNTQISFLDDQAAKHAGTMYSTTYFLNSFYYKIGISYQYIMPYDRLILGVAYTPQQKINTTRIFEKAYTTDINNLDNYGYILSDRIKGKIKLPAISTIGVQYSTDLRRSNVNAKLNSKLSVMAEYKNASWSNYIENFVDSSQSYNGANSMRNSSTFSLGVEYIPQQMFLERVKTGYITKVRYRIGTSFSTLPQVMNQKAINKQTYSIGFGFPFLMLRSTSSINFSVAYSKQYSLGNTGYNDKFVSFNLGISIAPGINDRWFRKYKID